jgi:hypothetical protein
MSPAPATATARPARTRPTAGLAACTLGLAATSFAAGPADELAALRAEILALIGGAPCANLVHCRALPLGRRPCGGPAEYVAYSSFLSDRALLEAKAYEYTFLYEEQASREPLAGTCVVLPEPRLQCVDRRCRIENAPPP